MPTIVPSRTTLWPVQEVKLPGPIKLHSIPPLPGIFTFQMKKSALAYTYLHVDGRWMEASRAYLWTVIMLKTLPGVA